ncbi:PREDICTED: luciferin 4-monooxygenase-like [Dinoponera quadriceps]|uniref:Luciferin 4-monooxygenase-like n=1 Tax=Dinoponera quadriceps TaxID=609295 RepID=A0A6P3XJR4_DINQU|nr:PREDICTED: luciferin 4-monooxygenase-like [Dinoponera quadriceps]
MTDIKFISNMEYTCHKPPLKIKNNILIGEEIPYQDLYNTHLGQIILRILNSQPNFVAQIDAETGKKITYKEIKYKSVRLAMWMIKENVDPGDFIGICTNHHIGLYIILACLYIGAIPMIRKYDQCTDYEISSEITRNNPKMIFVDKMPHHESKPTDNDETEDMAPTVMVLNKSQSFFNKIYFACDIFECFIDEYSQTEIDKFICTELDQFKLETAVIMYTRGIEGLIKAVKISHKAFMAPAIINMINMLSGARGMWVGTHFSFPNLILTIQAICNYIQVIIFEGDDMTKMCRTIEKYKVRWVRFETGLCQAFLDSKGFLLHNTSSLRMIMLNGSRMEYFIYTDLVKLFPKVSIVSLYGTIETGVIAYQRCSGKPGSNGYIGKNVQLMITNMSKTPLGPNKPGNIWCKCWGMSKTYYDIKDANPMQAVDENGWHDTGDIGYYDKDGDIYVTDRAVDLIKFREYYFSPSIVETIIKEQPAVYEVAVVAVPNITDGQHPKAFITTKTAQKVQEIEKKIEEMLENKLGDCMKMRGGMTFLNKMPYGPDYKINRKCLRHKAKLNTLN